MASRSISATRIQDRDVIPKMESTSILMQQNKNFINLSSGYIFPDFRARAIIAYLQFYVNKFVLFFAMSEYLGQPAAVVDFICNMQSVICN